MSVTPKECHCTLSRSALLHPITATPYHCHSLNTFFLGEIDSETEIQDWTTPYNVFKEAGFRDAFNPRYEESKNYPATYWDPENTWTGKNKTPETIDYIMAKSQKRNVKIKFQNVKVVNLKTSSEISFSDHNSVKATVKISMKNKSK